MLSLIVLFYDSVALKTVDITIHEHISLGELDCIISIENCTAQNKFGRVAACLAGQEASIKNGMFLQFSAGILFEKTSHQSSWIAHITLLIDEVSKIRSIKLDSNDQFRSFFIFEEKRQLFKIQNQ